MKFNVLLKYYWEDAGQTVVFVAIDDRLQVAITCFVRKASALPKRGHANVTSDITLISGDLQGVVTAIRLSCASKIFSRIYFGHLDTTY